MTLFQKIIKKGFWLYFFTIIILPCAYIIRVTLSHELSVSDLGIIYGIISLISIFATYNDLGMSEGIRFYLPKYIHSQEPDKVKGLILGTFAAQSIIGISIIIIIYLLSDWLGVFYFHDTSSIGVLKVLLIYYFFLNIFQLVSNILIGFQDTFSYQFVDFLKTISLLLFTFFIFNLDGNALMYSWGWPLSTMIGCIFGCAFLYRKHSKQLPSLNTNFYLPKEFLKYSVFVLLGYNGRLIINTLDQQMILFFLGADQLGYYSNYLSLMNICLLIISPFAAFVPSLLSDLIHSNQNEKVSTLLSYLYNGLTISGVYISIWLVLFGKTIAEIIFGSKFALSGELLSLGGYMYIFFVISYINFSILGGLKKIGKRLIVISVCAISNLVLNLIFIRYFGIIGVVYATFITWFILSIYGIITVHKDFPLTILRLDIILNLLTGAIILAGFKFYNILALDNSSLFTKIVSLITTTCCLGIIMLLLNFRRFKSIYLELKSLHGK